MFPERHYCENHSVKRLSAGRLREVAARLCIVMVLRFQHGEKDGYEKWRKRPSR